ncbi:MAG: ribosome-associated translation inhibitor RaiA [Spiroplasma sp.]|nr:ribosome-associated translation inhibitor RaiA [Spiroplasma sp.]
MIITIHGKNMEITPAISKSVEASLSRLEKYKKYIHPNTRAKVEIRSYPEKLYRITVSINIPFNKHLQCQVKHDDLYLAIKQIVNPLTQQLSYIKTQTESKNTIKTGTAILEKMQDSNFGSQVEELDDFDNDDQDAWQNDQTENFAN